MQELQIYMFITDTDECEPIDFGQKKKICDLKYCCVYADALSSYAVKIVYLLAVQLCIHNYQQTMYCIYISWESRLLSLELGSRVVSQIRKGWKPYILPITTAESICFMHPKLLQCICNWLLLNCFYYYKDTFINTYFQVTFLFPEIIFLCVLYLCISRF